MATGERPLGWYCRYGPSVNTRRLLVEGGGEVLESFVTKDRDKAAALKFMKKAMKRFGSPEAITTDGVHITLRANVDLPEEAEQAADRAAQRQRLF